MALSKEQRTFFADQLRTAREKALRDAEDFDQVIHAVERLGKQLDKKGRGLGEYKGKLCELASESPLAVVIPDVHRGSLTPFSVLYDLMQEARNDALHEGAYARRLTDHTIQVAIVLEDALRRREKMVSDFMVRNPTFAEDWQPLAFIRQTMLANSFSWLPVKTMSGDWRMISDQAIVTFLTTEPSDRKERLQKKVSEACDLTTVRAEWVAADESVATVVDKLRNMPLLVSSARDRKQLIGIVTAFDLL